MAGRAAAAGRAAFAVRFVRGRSGHHRGGVRPHVVERHHHHAGSGGYHLDHLPRACGVGTSPSYAGPPSHHRRRSAARTAVLSRAAATATAGAGDSTAANDTADNDTADNDTADNDQETADDGSHPAADTADT